MPTQRQRPNSRAQRSRSRPEWPYKFREVLSFLLTPSRWAKVREVGWSEALERLRVDLIIWIYHLAGAPRLSPDGRRDVLASGPILRPTAQRVLRAVRNERDLDTKDVLEIARDARGPADRQSFSPLVAEIAYMVAPTLGVTMPRRRKTALRDRTRSQWAMQTVIQRIINALANEADCSNKALNALQQDITSALATTQHPVAVRALRSLKSASVRARVVSYVCELLGRSQSPFLTSAYLKRLQEDGYGVQLLPNSIVPIPLPRWLARSEFFPSTVKEVVIPVLQQADHALFVRWSICPLCARPFPQHKHMTRACPPCRRRLGTRSAIGWRLTHARPDPVVFEVLPADSPKPVRLVIAECIRAPAALRDLA